MLGLSRILGLRAARIHRAGSPGAGLSPGPSSCQNQVASSRMYCACLLLLLLVTPRVDSSWWYIGALGARVICDNIPGLVNKQRQLCQRHPDIMQAIGAGTKEWIRECQHQFRHHRWNCSTLDRDHTVFGRVLLRSKSLRVKNNLRTLLLQPYVFTFFFIILHSARIFFPLFMHPMYPSASCSQSLMGCWNRLCLVNKHTGLKT
ncbi:hypothetical protein XENORESO_005519 [Xenotaenia resolanae]|uniref:Protein Wnt n=2 Tax=Goodeidae TaxID=28758 RepID=A0ABV0X577_9TELE